MLYRSFTVSRSWQFICIFFLFLSLQTMHTSYSLRVSTFKSKRQQILQLLFHKKPLDTAIFAFFFFFFCFFYDKYMRISTFSSAWLTDFLCHLCYLDMSSPATQQCDNCLSFKMSLNCVINHTSIIHKREKRFYFIHRKQTLKL